MISGLTSLHQPLEEGQVYYTINILKVSADFQVLELETGSQL